MLKISAFSSSGVNCAFHKVGVANSKQSPKAKSAPKKKPGLLRQLDQEDCPSVLQWSASRGAQEIDKVELFGLRRSRQ